MEAETMSGKQNFDSEKMLLYVLTCCTCPRADMLSHNDPAHELGPAVLVNQKLYACQLSPAIEFSHCHHRVGRCSELLCFRVGAVFIES